MQLTGNKAEGISHRERLNPETQKCDAIVRTKSIRFGGRNNKTPRLSRGLQVTECTLTSQDPKQSGVYKFLVIDLEAYDADPALG